MSDDLTRCLWKGVANLEQQQEAADRIEELEAKLAELEPKDGRPCSTDEFLAVLLDEIDDYWDTIWAIKEWVEGDWVNAVRGTTLAELKGENL